MRPFMYDCIITDDAVGLEFILRGGGDANSTYCGLWMDYLGEQEKPLFVAMRSGSINCANVLLRFGALPKDNLLHHAVLWGLRRSVEWMWQTGLIRTANPVRQLCRMHCTPLDALVFFHKLGDHVIPTAARLLIALGGRFQFVFRPVPLLAPCFAAHELCRSVTLAVLSLGNLGPNGIDIVRTVACMIWLTRMCDGWLIKQNP